MTDLATAAQAQALVDMGRTNLAAANAVGLSSRTVDDIIAGRFGWDMRRNLPIFRTYRAEQKAILEHAMTELAKKAVSQAEASIDKASFYQAVTGAAILVDKVRLLQGESTQNIAHLHSIDASSLDGLCSMLGQSLGNQGTSSTQLPQPTTQTPDK